MNSAVTMSQPTLNVSLDGITVLPRGYIATVKSYLERPAGGPIKIVNSPRGYALHRLTGNDVDRYRALFGKLGQEWLWWSRLLLSVEALTALLNDQRIEAFAIVRDGSDIGLLEWDLRETSPELAFLGLLTGNTGNGLGNWLMSETIQRLGAQPIRVNTCTLDHPGALGFYRHWGYVVANQAIEIVPDPRLSGVLCQSAGRHVPVLAPD